MIAGYVRVSTEKQAELGVSLEAQVQSITAHVKMLELIEDEREIAFYVDDGYSAGSLERPKMKKLIGDMKKGKIDILFCYDLSRISRDVFDTNTFLKLIKKYNVILKFLCEEIKVETASDRLNTNVKSAFNQYERERVVERTNFGLIYLVENGMYPCGGVMSFGYIRNKDKTIAIHDEEAKIVKEIIDMANKRYRLTEITNHINSIQSIRKFTVYQIKRIICNKRYCGILEYKGKVYDDIFPAIVSEQEIENARLFYMKDKFKKNEEYFFDEIVYCSCCGTKMSCTHSYGRNDIYYYYACHKCAKTIPQKRIEEYLGSMDPVETNKEYKVKIDREYYKISNKIKEVKDKYLNDEYTDREYCSLSIPLEDRLNELIHVKNIFKLNKNHLKYSDLTTKKDKKKYAETYIKKITVNPLKKIVINVEFLDK